MGFTLDNKELYDNGQHIGTIVKQYPNLNNVAHWYQLILLNVELRACASPNYLKRIRTFVKQSTNTATARIVWF
jgi:hypothetical protein